MTSLEQSILKNLDTFIQFARKRVGDEHLAKDLVQESLLKAIAADHQPSDSEAIAPWFYRILRRSIIDLYRRQDARSRAYERFSAELPETPSPEEEATLCECLGRLIPFLPEQYSTLLQRIDLQGESPEQVAADLGLTRNNLTVRLHRARKQLRDALITNCQSCSTHGCTDCTCEDSCEPSEK